MRVEAVILLLKKAPRSVEQQNMETPEQSPALQH